MAWIKTSVPGNKYRGCVSNCLTMTTTAVFFFFPLPADLFGQKNLLAVFSNSSFLTLHFKADESVGYRGFKILLEELIQQPTQSELEGSSQCK